nr:hypothetical protein [Tanacetum cinerariifolium]
MLDKNDIIYTLDMFRAALKLPNSIVDNHSSHLLTLITSRQFSRSLVSKDHCREHDQIKFNVMQIFHDVVNKANVDYASLIWLDFLYYVMQSKKIAIQYPRFTKLIIIDLIEKYESIPKRLDKEYHTIKDDTPLVNMYTTREVMDYVSEYEGVEYPKIQPMVESTYRTIRIPRATWTPNSDVVQKKRKDGKGYDYGTNMSEIGSKPDKNGKRGEAQKSQEQSQWIEQENAKRMVENANTVEKLLEF